jgi:hypothetical protein
VSIARFPVGRIVATPGALTALEEAGETPGAFLRRHVTGDWGELDEHDRQENEFSVAHAAPVPAIGGPSTYRPRIASRRGNANRWV